MEPKQPERVTDADEQIRDYYENQPLSETEAFPVPMDTLATTAQRAGKVEWVDDKRAQLSGGDPEASLQGLDAGDETPGGSNPTPDQDLVDEIGEAVGVTYADDEPLKLSEKAAARDEARWELNPASSEDYQERQALQSGPDAKTVARKNTAVGPGSAKRGRRKKGG